MYKYTCVSNICKWQWCVFYQYLTFVLPDGYHLEYIQFNVRCKLEEMVTGYTVFIGRVQTFVLVQEVQEFGCLHCPSSSPVACILMRVEWKSTDTQNMLQKSSFACSIWQDTEGTPLMVSLHLMIIQVSITKIQATWHAQKL